MLTKEQRKEKAIEIMQKLDIYEPYITGYKEHDQVCFYERFGGYWVHQEPEIEAKMREIERQYNVTIYAITHELTEFGELWSFLCVSNKGSRYACTKSFGNVCNDFICSAYVWNKSGGFVDFGSIEIRSFGGGLMRIG